MGRLPLRMKRNKIEKGYDYLVKALTELLSGDKEKSFESFKKAMEYDPSFEIPYIYMGRIMRDKGYWNNALTLHSQLLIRKRLRRYTKESIYKEIVLDYVKGKDYKNAYIYYKKLKGMKETEDMIDIYANIIKFIYKPEKIYKLLEKKEKGRGALFLKEVLNTGYENKDDYKFVLSLAKHKEAMPYSSILAGLICYENSNFRESLGYFLLALGYEESANFDIFNILTDAAYKEGLMNEVEHKLKELERITHMENIKKALFEIMLKKGDYDSAKLYVYNDSMDALIKLKEGKYKDAEDILRKFLRKGK